MKHYSNATAVESDTSGSFFFRLTARTYQLQIIGQHFYNGVVPRIKNTSPFTVYTYSECSLNDRL